MCPCGVCVNMAASSLPISPSLPPSLPYPSCRVGGGGQAGVAREGRHPSGPDPIDLRGEAAVRTFLPLVVLFVWVGGWWGGLCVPCACGKGKDMGDCLFLLTYSWHFFPLRLLFVSHLLFLLLLHAHNALPRSPQPSPALPSLPPSIHRADDKTLSFYNVVAGGTIHMVLQLRGGDRE